MAAYCDQSRPLHGDADRNDHNRDLRKHEPRPTDQKLDAVEVAVLVKAVDILAGAALIEQYAQTVAAGARLEGVQQAYDRIDRVLR